MRTKLIGASASEARPLVMLFQNKYGKLLAVQLASATGLEGKGEKEACYNLFSHARTFPEFWEFCMYIQNSGEFCMYVNEFTVNFTIIIISNIST